jgi:hypothetical protein
MRQGTTVSRAPDQADQQARVIQWSNRAHRSHIHHRDESAFSKLEA